MAGTDDILEALKGMTPVSLEEINSESLMDRVEIKYIFPVRKLSKIISMLEDKYKVLEIKNTRALPYNTVYLDTPDYYFYNQHIRGEYSRYKIRYRTYEINGDSFLEIKMKTNKKRTLKWRVENAPGNGFDTNAERLICQYLPIRSSMLGAVLVNRFSRITVVGKETTERITLDFNISFSDPGSGLHTEMPHLAVIELKKMGFSLYSPFNTILKSQNIYPEGFSKYCTGNALLKRGLKTNMVKPKILLLNKIENEYITANHNRSGENDPF